MRWLFVTCLLPGLVFGQARVVAAAPHDSTAAVARVLDLTNAERQRAGLAPLAFSSELTNSAQSYSQVMAMSGCFSHGCGPITGLADRDGRAGYTGWTALGENIAVGYRTPEAVVAGWMASPGHRANILSPNYTEIGVGMAIGGQMGMYWTQEFGSRPGPVVDFAQLPAEDPSPPIDADGSESLA